MSAIWSNLQQHSTAYRGNACSTRLDSAFLKVKAVRYFGKTQKPPLTYQEAQVTFLVTSGVRQEYSESPCLFN